MAKLKKNTCNCCGQQFESMENVNFCNECENHWILD